MCNIGYCDFQSNIIIIFQIQYFHASGFYTLINCLQERAGGGEGVVLNREITITNNLIYFLNLSSSILLSQNWLVQTSRANLPIGYADWNFITTLFLYQPISSSNGFSPIQFVQSSFSVYKKKTKKKETA